MPPESSAAKCDVTIRISDEAHERVRAWAFLQRSSKPGAFLSELIEHLAKTVADRDPTIDQLVQISAEYRASQIQPDIQTDQ